MSSVKAPAAPALPGSERPDYRGKCLYKTGKCVNERALKTSGTAHNLCNDHRNRQNRHQRKLDAKNRLHKQERRVSIKDERREHVAPYRRKKRQSLVTSVALSDDADSCDSEAATSLAAGPGNGAASLPSTLHAPVPVTCSSGVVSVPHRTQAPPVADPFVLQDFDGIVVPLPSYLEGPERIEFRSRIYQKVLDFISEECILRFGAKIEPASVDAPTTTTETALTTPMSSSFKTEAKAVSDEDAPALSDDRPLAASTSHVPQSSLSVTKESMTTSTTKKVH